MLPYLRQWTDDGIIGIFGGTRPVRLRAVLAVLPPRRRAAIFAGLARHPSSGLGQLGAMPLLDVLPPDTAAAEARRMLDWHASTWHSSRTHLDNPDIPLRLTAYLPYAQASSTLRDATRAGDAHRRGLARNLMLGCAARTGDSAIFAGVLAELADRAANEQDPLRESLLSALCTVPPALLNGACVPALDRLAESATAARDCSEGTRRTLTRLACRVLRHTETATGLAAGRTGQAELADWGIGVFVKLATASGRPGSAALARSSLRNCGPAGTVDGGGRRRIPGRKHLRGWPGRCKAGRNTLSLRRCARSWTRPGHDRTSGSP